METDTLLLLVFLALVIIPLVGLLLIKSGDEGTQRKKVGRFLIYGLFFHKRFARLFERPLSGREKIGWAIVVFLMILILISDFVL